MSFIYMFHMIFYFIILTLQKKYNSKNAENVKHFRRSRNVADWSRTSGLPLRRRTLYPTELQQPAYASRIQLLYFITFFKKKLVPIFDTSLHPYSSLESSPYLRHSQQILLIDAQTEMNIITQNIQCIYIFAC